MFSLLMNAQLVTLQLATPKDVVWYDLKPGHEKVIQQPWGLNQIDCTDGKG